MGDITAKDGRTVLFVSHNLAAVRGLCKKGYVLENGLLKFTGNVENALNVYSENAGLEGTRVGFDVITKRSGNGNMRFLSLELNKNQFSLGDDVLIQLKVENLIGEKTYEMVIQIFTADGIAIYHMMPRDSNFKITSEVGIDIFNIVVSDIRLFPGLYFIALSLSNSTGHDVFDSIENVINFEISDGGNYTSRNLPRVAGLIFANPMWQKL
jgi:lipopolysaccharide transport system ATP-binding protein